ncbi:MAG: UDP-2,3-diacylglucosamine diphosphatase LpxI [Nitrospirae bacterium]|nr:UDP-2,3-diacylglucosamine diphosphatase LpxI [Nitrospirota bacterium]
MQVKLKLGLIAGNGDLPKAIAEEARAKGYEIVAVGLEPLAEKSLALTVDEIKWINVGKLGEIMGFLKESGVKEAVMAGKVPKSLLYKSKILPDLRAIKLLFSLKDKSDDSILLALAKELKKEGIALLNTTDFTSSLLTPEGVLTKEGPTENEWKDIAYGWRIAKEIGRLDIGQTVIVKNQAVMAIEAIEGTDEAIKRGGALAGSGAVIIKVSKPQQDMRFDVPVVGPDTLRSMFNVQARVLAVESGKSIILKKEKLIKKAEEAGIAIVGVSDMITR